MSSSWDEIQLLGATVRFTNRKGGFSDGRFSSLNLGLADGDLSDTVLKNRRSAAAGATTPDPLAMRQVHGKVVALVDSSSTSDSVECDALVTRERGLPLLAVAADCLPVALVGDGIVGVVHAGWRGLSAGVIEETIALMRGLGARELKAAVGPAAGRCCYEVGPEVVESLGELAVTAGSNLDLPGTAEGILEGLGVKEPVMMSSCTVCDQDSGYFSYRRDGAPTGRQGVIAWLNS